MSYTSARKRLVGLVALLLPTGLMLAQPDLTAEWSRIDSTISALAKETLDESLQRLVADDQQYFMPGFMTGIMGAQTDLEWMLSNRRSVKVISQLSDLPETIRANRCKDAFAAILRTHDEAARRALRHALDPSAPTNTQSMLATKLGLCAVMFVAANRGMTEVLSNQFAQLDRHAAEIERLLTEGGLAYPQALVSAVRHYAIPDNQCQVNVLQLLHSGAGGDPERLRQIGELCEKMKMTKREIPIVPWDARITWFDTLHPRTRGSPIDTSKGVQTQSFYEWNPGDGSLHKPEAQKQLVRQVRELAF